MTFDGIVVPVPKGKDLQLQVSSARLTDHRAEQVWSNAGVAVADVDSGVIRWVNADPVTHILPELQR